MRKLVRGLIWTMKAALLAVALAALVLWSLTRDREHRQRSLNLSWYTVQPDRTDDFDLAVGGGSGRIFINWERRRHLGERGVRYGRWLVDSKPRRFQWRLDLQAWEDGHDYSSWGPIHWWAGEGPWSGIPRRWLYGNAPYWLVISAAGAWPLSNIALNLRRRARRRRRDRAGACRQCGYDLRATPERCPECGTIRAQ
jgi:hypothetical protein